MLFLMSLIVMLIIQSAKCRRSSEPPKTLRGWITSLMTTMMIMILMRLEISYISQIIKTTKVLCLMSLIVMLIMRAIRAICLRSSEPPKTLRGRTLNQQQWQRNQAININVFPFRCSAVYKLDNTTCSSMQLTCGRWYLPNKDPVQCR